MTTTETAETIIVERAYDSQEISNDERISIVREHFTKKGYRVHSGLQFGCDLVLYADDPDRVHSDFSVFLVQPLENAADGEGGLIDWRTMQTLVRSMTDVKKTLILANVRSLQNETTGTTTTRRFFFVEELAVASEHAPFRHKSIAARETALQAKVGVQTKSAKGTTKG